MEEPISATDNSQVVGMDNAQQPISNANETGATNGQAQEGTPEGDLFQGIDPRKLPPQAKVFYDQMLKDYRDKTGRLSETIKAEIAKATEPLKSKADLYDQIATQEEFVKQWNEYVQKSQSQGKDPEGPQSDPVLKEMKAQLQEMNQKIQLSEMAQVTEAFAEAVNEKGEKIHPEFDKLNELQLGQIQDGKEVEPFSLLRACVELAQGANPQEKLANGYKSAKATYDAIFELGKKSGMGRLQTKIANGTQPPSHSGGETLSLTEKKPKNAREALEMARKGVVVSRE